MTVARNTFATDRKPRVDLERIAQIAAMVEQADPNWRKGEPVRVPLRRRGHRIAMRVEMICPDGARQTFPSVTVAARRMGIGATTIYQAIRRGAVVTSNGSRWRFLKKKVERR